MPKSAFPLVPAEPKVANGLCWVLKRRALPLAALGPSFRWGDGMSAPNPIPADLKHRVRG